MWKIVCPGSYRKKWMKQWLRKRFFNGRAEDVGCFCPSDSQISPVCAAGQSTAQLLQQSLAWIFYGNPVVKIISEGGLSIWIRMALCDQGTAFVVLNYLYLLTVLAYSLVLSCRHRLALSIDLTVGVCPPARREPHRTLSFVFLLLSRVRDHGQTGTSIIF